MSDYLGYPYDRVENLCHDYIVATYQIFGSGYSDILKKTAAFAVGQTVGTWVKVPGITDEMREKYQGRIIGIYPVDCQEETIFIIKIAFPLVNFAGSFNMLFTALVGNDVSTAMATKLVDIELQGGASKQFDGPSKGIKELRELTGVMNRPIILNMIKPCLGFDAKTGANFFYESALGGVDIIKDDELLGNVDYNHVADRVRLYGEAAKRAGDKTGKETVYMVNISDTPSKTKDNIKAAIDAGAKACLINFVFGSIDLLMEITKKYGNEIFIMAHYAGVAVLDWPCGGISPSVYLGTIPRLAGAHSVMTMYPNFRDSKAVFGYLRTVQNQMLPLAGINPLVTAVGGGITPINQQAVQCDLGKDVVIGIGGAIQGHPMGTTQGSVAAVDAVSATAEGMPLEEKAKSSPALKAALDLWGKT